MSALAARGATAKAAALAAVALAGCHRDDHLANLEPARVALAGYLEAWRTLDFRTMYGLTAAAALGGQTADQYEAAANTTLLENALVASHMRYAVGDAHAEGEGARVDLSWTLPDMAIALRETTALVKGGVAARDLLDRIAPLVTDGRIPLLPHTLVVAMVWEDARWKVDPATMKVTTHAEAAP